MCAEYGGRVLFLQSQVHEAATECVGGAIGVLDSVFQNYVTDVVTASGALWTASLCLTWFHFDASAPSEMAQDKTNSEISGRSSL